MKRGKADQEADPKLIGKLRMKLVVAAVVLALASLVSVLPEFLNVQANAAGGRAPNVIRTVIVLSPTEAPKSNAIRLRQCHPGSRCENGKNRIDIVVLRNGNIPDHPIKAVVETDTNCAPDVKGISHCGNRLKLSDGKTIEVRHDHNMRIYPCLTPGETVEVRSQMESAGIRDAYPHIRNNS